MYQITKIHRFRITWRMSIYALVFSFFPNLWSTLVAQENDFLIYTFKKHNDIINSIDIHPEKAWLVTGSKDRSIILWDIEQKRELFTIDKISSDVQSVSFSPDSKYLVGTSRNVIMVWTSDGEYINSLKGHATAVWSMDFNQSGNQIVTGSFDRNFRLWDFTNLAELHEFKGHSKSVLAVAFHPDGNLIASGSLDKTIRIWDTESNLVIHTLNGHSENIYSLDFSPAGDYLISSSRDKTLKLWDVKKGELIRTFEGHLGAVFNACFSPSGDHILSGSLDKTIKLWETSTGTCIYTFTGHEEAISAVAFLPDGNSFISGSYDKTARHWNISNEIFVDFYFKEEIEQEMEENPLFADKSKSESRQEYLKRTEDAKKQKKQLYQKYYMKYIEQLKNNTQNNE